MQYLALDKIRTDGGTQIREQLDEATIEDYAAVYREAAGNMPPVEAVGDGTDYWLTDGFHRLEAAKRAEVVALPVRVIGGTKREAVLRACGRNAEHGLRRTNADKRRAVARLLADDEWREWSDRRIAEECRVDHKTVGAIRAEMEATGEIPQSTVRTGADGREIDTTNIGANPPPPAPPGRSWSAPPAPPAPMPKRVEDEKLYFVDQAKRIIYNDGFAERPEAVFAARYAGMGLSLIPGRHINTGYRDYTMVAAIPKADEAEEKAGRSVASPVQAGDVEAGLWYAISHARRLVILPGRESQDAIYSKYMGQQDIVAVKGEALLSASIYETYGTRTPSADQPAAAPVEAPPEKRVKDEMWYPVNHGEKRIYDDPFATQKEGRADPRYGRASEEHGSFAIQIGKEINRGGNYATYALVEALPKAASPERASWADAPDLATRYKPGMLARCPNPHCSMKQEFPDRWEITPHSNWDPDVKPKVWECEYCGQRLSDALMDLKETPFIIYKDAAGQGEAGRMQFAPTETPGGAASGEIVGEGGTETQVDDAPDAPNLMDIDLDIWAACSQEAWEDATTELEQAGYDLTGDRLGLVWDKLGLAAAWGALMVVKTFVLEQEQVNMEEQSEESI